VTDEVRDAAADHFSEEQLGVRCLIAQGWQIYFVARYILDA
jgi:hypothetical protein